MGMRNVVIGRKLRISLYIIVGILTLLLSLVLVNGTYLRGSGHRDYDAYKKTYPMTRTQFYAIKSGIQASSSHNMQPWKIKIVSPDTFELYADLDKSLTVVDPNGWQMLISQGTFIEEVRNFCLLNDLEFELVDGIKESNEKIRSLEDKEKNSKDSVGLEYITTIRIKGELPEAEAIDSLSSATNQAHYALDPTQVDGFSLTYLDESQSGWLKALLLEGTVLESKDEAAMIELLNVFRFTKRDSLAYRYGLRLTMMNPLLQTIIGPILKVTSTPLNFGQSSISTFEARLANEVGYILIHKDTMDKEGYIELGRYIAELYRTENYSLRPAVQVLQDMDIMYELKHKLNEPYEEAVVFILGMSPAGEHKGESIRHKVMDLIVD